MSNVLTGDTWIIDTASATELTASIYGKRQRVFVKSIRWISPSATAGHQAIVTDGDGQRLWKAISNVSGQYSESELVERWIDGLIVPTLSSGELNITIV